MYASADIEEDSFLQKNIIYAMKTGVSNVRFDVETVASVDCVIINTTQISSEKVGVTLLLGFEEHIELDGYYFDFRHILDQFDAALRNEWELDTNSSKQLVYASISVEVDIGTDSNELETTANMTSVTEDSSESVISIDSDEQGIFSLYVSPDKLREYYYWTMIGILGFFALVTFLGVIDAKFIRYNEIFTATILLPVPMYVLDAVSGAYDVW